MKENFSIVEPFVYNSKKRDKMEEKKFCYYFVIILIFSFRHLLSAVLWKEIAICHTVFLCRYRIVEKNTHLD